MEKYAIQGEAFIHEFRDESFGFLNIHRCKEISVTKNTNGHSTVPYDSSMTVVSFLTISVSKNI